jgi:hypothetical protein
VGGPVGMAVGAEVGAVGAPVGGEVTAWHSLPRAAPADSSKPSRHTHENSVTEAPGTLSCNRRTLRIPGTHSLVAKSQPWLPSSQGWAVGSWVGDPVGPGVGETGAMQLVVEDSSAVKPSLQTHMKGKVGAVVGIAVGEAVGATVAVQLVVELEEATKPSKHSHEKLLPSGTHSVLAESHAWLPLAHGCSVGMCVGLVLGAEVRGAHVTFLPPPLSQAQPFNPPLDAQERELAQFESLQAYQSPSSAHCWRSEWSSEEGS